VGKKTVITIDIMKKEDIEQVLAIEQSSFSQPWSKNLFLSEFRSPAVSTLLVSLDGASPARRVTGYIVYWNVEDEMHILNVAVHQSHRRKGIAKKLVLSAVKLAHKKGAKRAFLEVRASNIAARNLYAGLGFIGNSIRRDYYDAPVEDAVVMTLEEQAFRDLVAKAGM
jgi:ribosomal-protein-alanine N-acetyltransferase